MYETGYNDVGLAGCNNVTIYCTYAGLSRFYQLKGETRNSLPWNREQSLTKLQIHQIMSMANGHIFIKNI